MRIPFRDDTHEYLVSAVYRDEGRGITWYETVAGSKAYIRYWDSGEIDWTWCLTDDAVLVDEPEMDV